MVTPHTFFQKKKDKKKKISYIFGNTLLEGVCIRLTWHLHNHDICYEYEGSFMHVCDSCH